MSAQNDAIRDFQDELEDKKKEINRLWFEMGVFVGTLSKYANLDSYSFQEGSTPWVLLDQGLLARKALGIEAESEKGDVI